MSNQQISFSDVVVLLVKNQHDFNCRTLSCFVHFVVWIRSACLCGAVDAAEREAQPAKLVKHLCKHWAHHSVPLRKRSCQPSFSHSLSSIPARCVGVSRASLSCIRVNSFLFLFPFSKKYKLRHTLIDPQVSGHLRSCVLVRGPSCFKSS